MKPLLTAIQEWRQKNPQGKKCQCIKETEITRPTVDKYWDICGFGEKKKNPADIVEAWRLSHPQGSKQSCINDTGVSRMTVFKYWNAGIKIGKEKGSNQLFFDF